MIRSLLVLAAIPVALIDARVKQYADAGLFTGVVLVAKGDSIVYQKAFGLADRTFKVPNTTSTRFQIASVSKPITAAAILLMAERGKLSLDDPVSKWVPDFPNGDRITIEELITHYSGLADTTTDPDYSSDWSRMPQTPASMVARLAKKPLRAEPGKEYRYSNSNYHLLALIIEKVSGEPYGDFLAANIFQPLGMTSTGHHGDETAIIANLSSGYLPEGADALQKPPYLDWSSKTGNGSLYTTAGDLLKFHHALQHGGLLRPETVKMSYGFDLPNRRVGYFWFHHTKAGHRSVYINGSSPGFKAHFERFIDDDVAVIVLSNLYISAASPIGDDIGSLLWEEKPSLEAVPRRVARQSAELDQVVGQYQFDKDFFVPNLLAKIERRGDYLAMIYPGGSHIPLVPTDNGYFDRAYWSFVRFEGDKMIYRNGGADYVGVRETKK
jgi:D-alanyl-D-alanine carboxypeptidase